ncbi:hypothetical protein PPYR_04871 [Photinus pyralis]|uniref:Uncharacterized protein n=1 Tax=Photinus pyralis TaxID=7054 RepID=A0A1Y1LKC8_PHOPY|nr:uncharacterized protein LOC116163113 [Photinus pyralis]XP_031332824.1 uncharacterized protein LOC116163113 [Photinus pyralis]XP_031332825.1 uncharacterized protein LOC116163113 [Photinus pyralis]KAB0802685.1 hypothetical protein PPYR_04871 [Photinus pyralis]
MSAICQNFVQNAWKKELCSNCFKSKDEHQITIKKLSPPTSETILESIIKSSLKSQSKSKHVVSFTNEISKVIGYGGEDWSEIEEDHVEETEEETDSQDTDEEFDETEKELRKITKRNTDFNTVNANLLNDNSETKKSYTRLKLGKPQIDSEGRKHTLMVSVTPFGQDKKTLKPLSQIPVAKTNKDGTENKQTPYLKNEEKTIKIEEKSLLEEISETLEKSKTPIQIISRKKILAISKVGDAKDKENEMEPVNIEKNKANKTSIPERKNGITRAPIIKRDQEKPAIYQTSIAKIELLNNKNLKLTKDLTNQVYKSEALNNPENSSENKVEDQNVPESTVKSEAAIEFHLNNAKTKNISPTHNASSKSNAHSEDCLSTSSNPTPEVTCENDENMHSILSQDSNCDSMPPESREQAGEPDGHADPDGNNEPPALPTTPPPLETRSSFLHGNNGDKPKLPLKPSAVLIRKPVLPTNHLPETPTHTLSSFSPEPRIIQEDDSAKELDIGRTPNKRKAPKPPSCDESFLKNTVSIFPTLQEMEKRASSCSSQLRNESPHSDASLILPDSVPKKVLSQSTDSLSTIGIEEKKKSKGRFSLKKFLRMSSSKDVHKVRNDSPKYEEVKYVENQTRPRLVIVHPLDLNGAQVEVVSKPIVAHEQFECSFSMPSSNIEYQVPKSIPVEVTSLEQRLVKPPPPPRNLDDWNRKNKPNLPHPPKSVDIINKQKHLNRINNLRNANDSVYANIGEVRSAIIPNKPQRTASMREREALAAQHNTSTDSYEPVEATFKTNKENVYDYINCGRSSSSEFDSSSPEKNSPTSSKNPRYIRQIRSNSNVDVSGDYFKFQTIPRSASLTYCGSETESEIYAPYSFYGSESEVAEEDCDWTTHNGRTHKLRSRKGRSIVHKNLEDNYGAVIVANHEALAQVLENIQQGVSVQPALRGLKTASNLRWSNFSIKENLPPLTVGSRVFHQAVWGVHHVTIIISTGSTPINSQPLGTFTLNPITEFTDLIPAKYTSSVTQDDSKLIQASVAVLPWIQVNTIQTYAELLKTKLNSAQELFKDACFIVLQLVNSLKVLQAQGIEELPLSLTSFVIYKEMEKDTHHRLCVIQGLGEELTHKKENIEFGSLCECAASVLMHLLPSAKLTPLLHSLLSTERAVSLTQAKSVLEYTLWGPADVSLSSNIKDRELALQRWLDLQRATVLHGLVCARIQLTVYEECHLLFLVRSNAKMMCDASLLLDSNKQNTRNN